MYLRIITEKN